MKLLCFGNSIIKVCSLGVIDEKLSLVLIMAWCQTSTKLSFTLCLYVSIQPCLVVTQKELTYLTTCSLNFLFQHGVWPSYMVLLAISHNCVHSSVLFCCGYFISSLAIHGIMLIIYPWKQSKVNHIKFNTAQTHMIWMYWIYGKL